MRVAFFTDTYHPQVNGLVTSVTTSKAALEAQGHQVDIYAPEIQGAAPEKGVYRLASVTYPPQPEYSMVLPWGRGFPLRKFGPADLIHSHAAYNAGLLALALAKWKRLPLVMTYHTLWEQYVHYAPLLPRRLALRLNRGFSRWMCERCDLVLAPTQAIKDVLLGYGVRSRIEVLPTGLSPDVFERSSAKKTYYGVAEQQTLLSSAGRLGPEKRFHLLLDALAACGDKLGDWQLCLAGDGPQRPELEAQAKRLGLGARVQFLGYLPRTQVLDLMQASDLFVFPSPTETQGMVVLEAMGRGTPVLGVDAMGVGQMMRGERGGWLAQPDDAASLSGKLELALSDTDGRSKKAAEALVLAREYSADVVNAKLADFYGELVGGRV